MKFLNATILLTILLFCLFTKAQDTIVFKNGREHKVVVLEQGKHFIKWYKYGSKQKLVFSVPTYSVIGYKKEDGTTVSVDGRNINSLELQYLKLISISQGQHRRGMALTINGTILLGGAVGCMSAAGFFIHRNVEIDAFMGASLIMLGSALTLIGVPLTTVGAINIRRANKGFRKAKDLNATIGFNPLITPSINTSYQTTNFRAGLGMRINF